jgi:N-acetyl-anhydromuramyl-L-alanine amidase AmpD
MHTIELGGRAPRSGDAKSALNFNATRQTGSAHWYVDTDNTLPGVPEGRIAWQAPGCNNDGVGIEQAASAADTPAMWADDAHRKVLARSAAKCREVADRYGIPLVRLTNAELKAGKRGIVDHNQVSQVYGKSSHWDCGPNFPWDYFMSLVQKSPGVTQSVTVKPTATVDQGKNYTSRPNADIQRFLNSQGANLKVDNDYGPLTTAAVKMWQAKVGLVPDGLWGPLSDAKAFPPAPAVRSTIRLGSKNADVGHAQTRLNAHGFRDPQGKALVVDNDFGAKTDHAVRNFQKAKGLVVDGVVGPKTWPVLG